MSSKKRNIYIFLGKVVLTTLLIMFCIRTFFIEPYTVSSIQMETALIKGDKILIDRTAYGIRMPITIFTIPFTFDRIGGMKSYSTIATLPYKRLFAKEVKRNDIILFNNPTDSLKPLDKRELLLSRCVALPGDTIRVKQGILQINNQEYISSPDATAEYFTRIQNKQNITEIAERLEIPISFSRDKGDTTFLQLNKLNAFILNKSLPDSIAIIQLTDTALNYSIPIPFKGKIISLNTENVTVYKQAILQEEGKKARITDGKLYINGKEQAEYTFKDNYYWVLSDNMANSSDSRSLGFIPFKNIIGKACFIWYNSTHKERSCTSI